MVNNDHTYIPVNRDATLAVIREHGPIGTKDIAVRCGVNFERISAAISTWFKAAKDGWEHVHRASTPGEGPAYTYRFDASIPARKPTSKLTSRERPKRDTLVVQERAVPVVKPPPPPPAPKVADRLVAVVLWDEGDDVVLLDGNGGLIRGRRVQ
jgi:hypothetical protein